MDNVDKVRCLVWYLQPVLINDKVYYKRVPFKYFDIWQDCSPWIQYSGVSKYTVCGYCTEKEFLDLDWENRLLDVRSGKYINDVEVNRVVKADEINKEEN